MTFAERMDTAAESSIAKLFFRLGTPVALAIGAYFFQQMQADLKGMNSNVASMQSDLRYVNARIDERVIRTINAQDRRLDNHDDRLRIIETDVQVLRNAVRTP